MITLPSGRIRRGWPVALLAAISAAQSLLAAPGVEKFARQPNVRYEAMPLERSRQNHLLVRLVINGKPALFGVDSGAPVSAISLTRREHFGLTALHAKSSLPGRLRINGRLNRVAVAHHFQIGALNLLDEPLVAIDLSGSARAAQLFHDHQIDGIIGADILFPTCALLDCQAQLLVMKVDPEAPGGAPAFDHRGWRAVPMSVSRGWNFYVDAAVNGVPAKLMVDTGAFATLLHKPFVAGMRIPLRNTSFTSGGVNLRERGVQMATIRRLTIGSLEIKGKDVGVIDLEGLINTGLLGGTPPVAGLLGSEVLRAHHGIIDFGNQILYLKR